MLGESVEGFVAHDLPIEVMIMLSTFVLVLTLLFMFRCHCFIVCLAFSQHCLLKKFCWLIIWNSLVCCVVEKKKKKRKISEICYVCKFQRCDCLIRSCCIKWCWTFTCNF
jgi:hypothetical protein